MQLLIDRLPVRHVEQDGEYVGEIHTLRHWLVYPDGRIFFQDEKISVDRDGVMIGSERSDWSQLPTPPQLDTIKGVFTYGGLPGVVTHSGKAYLWAAQTPVTDEQKMAKELLRQANSIHEWPHTWIPFAEPVPQTLSSLEG